MDSVQKDKILNHLGIMQKAALNVADEGDVGEERSHVFGHLHIVFRDWRFQGDEKSVTDDIFKPERGADTATAVRNQIRSSIKESFQSVSVWLFPPPMENVSALRSELTVQESSVGFRNKLRDMRRVLVSVAVYCVRENCALYRVRGCPDEVLVLSWGGPYDMFLSLAHDMLPHLMLLLLIYMFVIAYFLHLLYVSSSTLRLDNCRTPCGSMASPS